MNNQLLTAIIQLCKTICECRADGEPNVRHLEIERMVVKGLAAAGGSLQLSERQWTILLRKIKKATGDLGAGTPGYLTGASDEREENAQTRSLRGELLANCKKAAGTVVSVWQKSPADEAVFREFCALLGDADRLSDVNALKSALRRSEALVKYCLVLEGEFRQNKEHERYMREAIRLAKKAGALGEVPIGCVIVHDGRIIGRGYNRRSVDRDVLAHAEIIAMHKACRSLGDWRLSDCTLYVTLEPCPMCAGAMVQSRLTNCVIGSASDKSGSAGTVVNLLEERRFNHRVNVVRGVLEETCSEMLSEFFAGMREKVTAKRTP